MSLRELDLLRSEIGTLERFLDELTEDDFIERIQLEQRLAARRARLAEFEARPQPKSLPLTFRGAPVDGSRSIDATFASQALRAFVEATDTVAASLISNDLKDRGPLPGIGARSLRIVDTATGSFGFELELPASDDEASLSLPLEQDDPYADAIATTLALLDQAATDDEDAISDLVAKVHPRAAAKIRAFAKILCDHRAVFATSFEGKHVRFDDEAQVRRVVDSLNDEDISEEIEAVAGTLIGVLPHSREFEARLRDGAIIRGKFDATLTETAKLKQRWEDEPALLRLRVVRVRSTRRYVLLGVEHDATS